MAWNAHRVPHGRAGRNHASRRSYDPFSLFDIQPARPSSQYADDIASPAQVQRLSGWGIDATKMTKRQAGQLMGEQIRRFQAGLCSFKQLRLLAKHGVDAKRMKRELARKYIDAIAANGWRGLPQGFNEQDGELPF